VSRRLTREGQMVPQEATASPKRIIGLFPELLGVGGVQEAGRQTAAALLGIANRHGWSASFLGLNDPPGEQFFSGGGKQIWLRGFGRSKMRFVLAGIGAAWSSRKHRSGIVVAGHPHLALPAAMMRLVSPRLRTVVLSHGVEVWEPLAAARRSALLRADVLLAPSSDTAAKLNKVQGIPPEKIRKLAWPVDSKILKMAGAPAALLLPPTFPQGQVILTVGRWAASERYKGADELIKAVAQLAAAHPGLSLVAVGGGDDLARLRKLASECGIVDRVHFLEGISREELGACYARCDVFALPSTGEGFGLVFLEAMAFGRPLIGASIGGTTDLIEDGVNGLLVPPGNSHRLAETLSRLLRDEPLRRELGRQGAEMVRRKYGFATFQAGLENVLCECGLDSGARA
jgi:phosphatidylinositol alpha-1,6-mannosyltransferase